MHGGSAAPEFNPRVARRYAGYGLSGRTPILGRILGRYVLKEVLASWLVVTGVLLIILLTNQMARVLARAAENQYPQQVVLELIGLGALQDVSILMPIGLLLGVVLAFGRLYHDSEMTAALACGVGTARLYWPVSLLAVFVTAVLAWLTLDLGPQAVERSLSLRSTALRAGQFAPISPGHFRTFGGSGGAVVYAEGLNPDGSLSHVFVEREIDGRVQVAVANRARHALAADGSTHTLTLYNGERFEGVPGSAEFRIVHFGEHVIPVQVPQLTDAVTALEARPTRELVQSSDPGERAELHWRVALPVMCIVLTLLAVPLAHLRPRQGRFARVWLAVLVYLLYSNLVSAGKVWIARGTVPEFLGLWWVHAAVVLLAVVVIYAPGRLARWRNKSPA
jgi:lipopolysaccharide export system permease protein